MEVNGKTYRFEFRDPWLIKMADRAIKLVNRDKDVLKACRDDKEFVSNLLARYKRFKEDPASPMEEWVDFESMDITIRAVTEEYEDCVRIVRRNICSLFNLLVNSPFSKTDMLIYYAIEKYEDLDGIKLVYCGLIAIELLKGSTHQKYNQKEFHNIKNEIVANCEILQKAYQEYIDFGAAFRCFKSSYMTVSDDLYAMVKQIFEQGEKYWKNRDEEKYKEYLECQTLALAG